ncbi:MAG: hypothetical protein ABI861_00235 [Panacibacter sp.]
MLHVYKYCPEPVGENFTDWVTYTEPNEIKIERHFDDKRIKSCVTFLIDSRTGNAWSTEDVQQIFARESIHNLLKSGGGTFRLTKTMGDEGSRKPFTLKWNGIQLNILPENTKEVMHPPANDDIVAMVYVLTKIYRQQANNPDCKSLTIQMNK